MEKGVSIPEAAALPDTGIQEPLPHITPEMLGTLSEGERAVIDLLREGEGKISYEEMGRKLGLTQDGIKGRLKRARVKLRQWKLQNL